MKKKSAADRKKGREGKTAASSRIGGQPENDEDARAAGLSSATPGTKPGQRLRPPISGKPQRANRQGR